MIQIIQNPKFLVVGKVVLFCAAVTGILKILSISFPSDNFFSSLTGPMLTVVTIYLFLKLDKKSLSDIGLKIDSLTLGKFGIGFLFGIMVVSLLIVFVAYISDFKLQQNKNSNLLFIFLTALPMIILLAFMEEIAFRSYPLVTVKNQFGKLTAIIITSILFGLYHVIFGWGIIGFCSTTIWGFLFSVLALHSDGISMPTGFHSAINLTQLVFGLTGNSFSLWNIKGFQSERFFSNLQITLMIAPLIILAIGMKSVMKKYRD
jgi:membrane protease YdiL (CAAX protease family)